MIRDHQTSMTSNLISFANSTAVGFGLLAGAVIVAFADGLGLGLNVEIRTATNQHQIVVGLKMTYKA